MSTQYPAKIDDSITLPISRDNSTAVRASVLNEIRAAVIAIESALGVNPASVYGTVRARLEDLDTTLSAIIGGGSIFVAGGDLSGESISQVVVGLQGNPVSSTAPTNGYLLTWSDIAEAWEPAAAPVGFSAGGDLSGTESNQTVSKLNGTIITTAGGALPVGAVLRTTAIGTADWGQIDLADTDAITGVLPKGNQEYQDLVGDVTGNTGAAVVEKIQGYSVSNTAPDDGYTLLWSGFASEWQPSSMPIQFIANGDLSGSEANQTVIRLQGYSISSTAPTDGYLLTWSALDNYWEASPAPAAGVLLYEIYFASGLFTTTSSIFTRTGARQFDISEYPATIGSLTRSVVFVANVDKTSGVTSVGIQLYDNTNSVIVTGTDLTSTSNSNVAVTSATLTVGSSAGNIRSDTAAQYELQFRMNGGGGSDAVFLTNARLIISYA